MVEIDGSSLGIDDTDGCILGWSDGMDEGMDETEFEWSKKKWVSDVNTLIMKQSELVVC